MITIESGGRTAVGWPTDLVASALLGTLCYVEPALECNMGGPMSRSRELTLRSTILGDGVDHVSCPRVRSVALDFGEADPVPYVRTLLTGLGYGSPEAARSSLLPILQRCVCCVSNEIAPDRVDSLDPEVVLEQASRLMTERNCMGCHQIGQLAKPVPAEEDTYYANYWMAKPLVVEGQTIFSLPRAAFIRSILLNHLYHHRGQFGVYLRLLGANIPSAYGPSGDEMPEWMAAMQPVSQS